MRVRLLGLCAVAGLVMMVAASAHADWRTGVPMKEAPNDVLEAWGPGRFSVGYAQGAYLFVDGGVARQIHTGAPSVGTYYQPSDDCFITVNKDDFGGVRTDRKADGGRCEPHPGEPSPIDDPIIQEGGSVVRVRHAPDGGAAAVVYLSAADPARVPYVSEHSIYDAGTFSPMGATVRISDLTGVLGVGQVGDADYALLGTTSSEAAVVWIKLSDTTRAETQAQTGTTLGIVGAMDVFSAGNPANPFPYAVVGTQTGAMLQGSILASLEPIKPVQTLEGPVSDVSMNVGAGGDAGVGFGMAIVVLPDGGSQVVSPVPMLSDTKAGTVWRVRSVPESIAKAPLKHVVCTGASSCVFTVPQPEKDNIFFYTNDAGPELSVTAPGATVVETGTETSVTFAEDGGYRLIFAAEDPDGDPVLVTVPLPSGSTGGWTVVPDAGWRAGDPVVWDVTTPSLCEDRSLGSFRVSASDGLAAHEAYETVHVSVKHTRPPEVPPVVFANGSTVPGGGAEIELAPGEPPLVLRMTGGDTTAAGCRIHPRWEPLFSGTGVPSLAQDGGTALITPPGSFCAPEDGRFGFRLRVTDDAGLSSAQDFTVRVPATELTAFDAGVLQFDAGEGPSPSGELRVSVGSTLNCSAYRGLRAELWLERMDGGEVMPPETVSIPGTWQGRLDEVCGRPMLLKGVLEDDAGQRSPVFAQQVATPRMDVGLEPLPGRPALVARCGEQARVELTQTFPPGACQTPDVTWTQEQDGGPPLEQSVLSGSTVSLVTQDTGLDALVGKSLVMRVTASAGPDNESSHLVTVPITVEPFVKVRRRTELPAASETGLVGVSVELHNTSECGVTGVSYRESLEGLTFVEGSAKFDGQPVEADWKSQALTVTGLTLPGEGTGTLTYVARPHLVGERRMEGEARLGNEVISLRDDPGIQVPDSGCGCSGSGPGPVLFALGALVAAVRRRRR